MYKILFVAALAAELKIIKQEIKKNKVQNIDFDFFVHGVGSYNTILNLSRYLGNTSYDMIINIGICGYKIPVDVHSGNAEQNIPEKVIQLIRSENIHTHKEILFPVIEPYAPFSNIACSEVPVYDENMLGDNIYVDMESYGFEKVCEHFQIPRISLKVPYDKVGEETKNFDQKDALDVLQQNINYPNLIQYITKYLDSLPKKIDLSSYGDHFQFTFSQKIIFEKLYYKYISILQADFDQFFHEHKHEKKKIFLEKLKNKLDEYVL